MKMKRIAEANTVLGQVKIFRSKINDTKEKDPYTRSQTKSIKDFFKKILTLQTRISSSFLH